MKGNIVNTSLVHMPGPCGLSISFDGRYLLTTGTDTDIRAHDVRDSSSSWWRTESEESDLPEMAAAEIHNKAIGCVAISPNGATMVTGSDDGFVRIFSMDISDEKSLDVQAQFVQSCARFGGPVRALDFSPTGSFVAAAGDEPGVLKIIVTAQASDVKILRGANGRGCEATVALAFDPNGDFVATVGEKGEALIWDVDKFTLASSVSLNDRKAKCVTWSPNGSQVVFGTDKGVVVVSRSKWLFDYLLEDAGDQDDDDDDEMFTSQSGKVCISAVAWSSNGRYLLAASQDSKVTLWDVHQRKVLGSWNGQEAVQQLRWHPKANAFAVIDTLGQWGMVPDAVPQHLPTPQSDASSLQLPTLPDTGGKKKVDVSDLGEDEEEAGQVKRSKNAKIRREKQLERTKKKEKAATKKKDDELSVAEDDEELQNDFALNLSEVEADDEDELRRNDDSEGDDGNGSSRGGGDYEDSYADDLNHGSVPAQSKRRRHKKRQEPTRRSRPVQNAQLPFMPTATPLSEKKTKKKHILAWNLVGAVLSFDEGTHDVVEVEFADASKRIVGIKDHFGYSMGCLSETGVLLATPRTKAHGAMVTFRPFSSWSNNSEWMQALHMDEDVTVIALGQRFAAVATTPNNMIRIFSLSGIQTAVFAVPGDVVSVAAAGDKLVTVYSEPDSVLLKCEMVSLSSLGEVERVMFTGNIALSPKTSLEWIGFTSDSLELCTYDSNGWLWLLTDPKGGKRWVPVVQNAAKIGSCDWFWVAAATSDSLIGAPCLSSERFPPAKPRPALRPVPFSAPVIDRFDKQGKNTVSERLLRTKLRLNRAVSAKTEAEEMYNSDDDEVADAEDEVARMEVETDKCILALMEDACRNEHNMRALDLATRLHAKISFKYAIELAKHFKRDALAMRVQQVAAHKLAAIEEKEQLPEPEPVQEREIAGVEPSRKEELQPKERVGTVRTTKMALDEVTDDEDEDESSQRTMLDEKEMQDEKVEIVKPVGKAKPFVKKRVASVLESQASATGMEGKTAETKKAKIAATRPAKRSFHNRFMKK